MEINFSKYQGTGNDFVIIDNRSLQFSKNDTKLVKQLCDRKFGIGADGVILLENHPEADFSMVYYNADGRPGSMCGNGGRCIVAFAKKLGIINDNTTFEAVDGKHFARIKDGHVHLQMQDVDTITERNGHLFMDTGSPHHVEFVDQLDTYDVKSNGSRIRYSELYGEAGSNINFVETQNGSFALRTYERGVEDETLSCGTGATAVALGLHHLGKAKENFVDLKVAGGQLQVTFEKMGDGYQNIFLVGPATEVFNGTWQHANS
ncbi:MAG: diaminopimelate epimerase [Leeuwenhoekiella sp.]